MSIIKSIKQQLGLSGTATNNFTLDASAADGTMKLARGNAGATTQDVLTVDANGVVGFPQGHVYAANEIIQTLYFEDAGATNVSATTITNVTGSTKSITPKSTNSIILIHCSVYISGASPSAGVNLIRRAWLYEGTTATTVGDLRGVAAVSGAGSGISPIGEVSLVEAVTNSALTARSFGLGGYVTGTGSADYSYLRFVIMEVQQ